MTVDRASAEAIRVLVLDVDGVLTNAQLVLGATGEEIKAFSVRDGIGIKLAQSAGIEVAFVSARTSAIVERRAEMLGVTEVHQGKSRKLAVVREIAARYGVGLEGVAYVGDDVVDLEPVKAVRLGVAVGDACSDLLEAARLVTEAPGGSGAVRETVEAVLRARGVWDETVAGFLANEDGTVGSRDQSGDGGEADE